MISDCDFVKIARSEWDAVQRRLASLERRAAALEQWTRIDQWYASRNYREQLADANQPNTLTLASAIHDAVMPVAEDFSV